MQNGPSRSPPQTLPLPFQPYLLSIEEVADILGTNTDSGLDDAEVSTRQQQYGPNSVYPLDDAALMSLVRRWRRDSLAKDPVETNRQCHGVSATPRLWRFLWNWIIH